MLSVFGVKGLLHAAPGNDGVRYVEKAIKL